eukprot:3059539-Rhodomonas_salina.1
MVSHVAAQLEREVPPIDEASVGFGFNPAIMIPAPGFGAHRLDLAHGRTLCSKGGAQLHLHPGIQYKKPHFQYNLYQECGFLSWISGCSGPIRPQAAISVWTRIASAGLGPRWPWFQVHVHRSHRAV